MERTGTLHSASPPKYRRVSVGLRPPAGASAWPPDKDKDALLRPESTSSHLPQGALEDGLAGQLSRAQTIPADQYLPSGLTFLNF